MRFYHATPVECVASILRGGLRSGCLRPIGVSPPRHRHVFLFDSLESACTYAVGYLWEYDCAIIEVRVPKGWVEPDPYLRTGWAAPDPPGAWRTSSAIPPDRIVSVARVTA